MPGYGTLTFISGPMFAGKTTELLKRIHWAQGGERRVVLVLKPEIDKRYAEYAIVSHDGHTLAGVVAQPIQSWPGVAEDVEEVFIDEVQFLQAPHYTGDIVAEIHELLRQGIKVTAAGLDKDYRGYPFAISAALLAMADEPLKMRARCGVCGARDATHTFKKSEGGARIDIGAGDLYEARCARHYTAPESPNPG